MGKLVSIDTVMYGNPRSTWTNSFNGKNDIFSTFNTSKLQDHIFKPQKMR